MEHFLKLVGQRSPQHQQQVSIDLKNLSSSPARWKEGSMLIWITKIIKNSRWKIVSLCWNLTTLTCLLGFVTVQVHGFVFCSLFSPYLAVLQVSHKSLLLRELVVTSTRVCCCYEHDTSFSLCIVMKFLVCFLSESNFELGVPSSMKSANLVSMTKSWTESNKN